MGSDGNSLAFVSLRQQTGDESSSHQTRDMARPHIFEPLLRRDARHCRLINRTRGIVLAETIEPAFDSRTRRTGLLGRDTLAEDAVLAIAPSNAVHTIGMRFPIAVLFVTRAGRVTKRVLRLPSLRIAAS